MSFKYSAIVLAAAMVCGPVAVAQQAPITPLGQVSTVMGPDGSVLVLRAGKTYTLQVGDAIIEGDKVFTRTDGAIKITTAGCEISLGGRAAVDIVSSGLCQAPIMTLAATDVVGGVKIGIAGGGVGAAPVVLGLLAAGGGLAAASGDGDDEPASP